MFGIFLSGCVFGVCFSVIVLLCMLSDEHPFTFLMGGKKQETINSLQELKEDTRKTLLPKSLSSETELSSVCVDEKVNELQIPHLLEILDYLDDVNFPLKKLTRDIGSSEVKVLDNVQWIESKMKVVVDYNIIAKAEKELFECVASMKEHRHQLKLITAFTSDTSKVLSGFAKDLAKLSAHAKSCSTPQRDGANMSGILAGQSKDDNGIINSWWQALSLFLDSLANYQEDLASLIMDDVHAPLLAGQEDVHSVEKRTNVDGSKVVSFMKEHLQLFESRLKDKERAKEKLDKLISSPDIDEVVKRQQKYSASEEALKSQARKTYDAQRDFYTLLSGLHKDAQLRVIKSIVETQSLLFNFVEYFKKSHNNCSNIFETANSLLNTAALTLLQSYRENPSVAMTTSNWVMTTMAPSDSVRLRISNMLQHGADGYEVALQTILENLLLMSQGRQPLQLSKQGTTTGISLFPMKSLDMSDESTACLAARNPSILADLPGVFSHAIGSETCVWVNNLNGRLYRDVCHSNFFYKWFCSKLTYLMNKGPRPGFIDKFEVVDAEFGSLPPLLSNVRWSPIYHNYDSAQHPVQPNREGATKHQKHGASHDTDANGDDSSDEDVPTVPGGENGPKSGAGNASTNPEKGQKFVDGASAADFEYYAASTADMAFRSGIKFKIATKLRLNWPMASFPVIVHIELAEISGRIRFGVTKGYSFLSFLEDPLTRISVRTEIGSEKYKLNDIKQLSDFLTKKLKNLIHKKFVHPNSHKFRLPWPRTWWPEGTENLFMPTSSGASGADMEMQNSMSSRPSMDTVNGGSPSLPTGPVPGEIKRQDTIDENDQGVKLRSSTTITTAQAVNTVKNKLNSLSNWFNKSNTSTASLFSAPSTASTITGHEFPRQKAQQQTKESHKDNWGEKIGKALVTFESRLIQEKHNLLLKIPAVIKPHAPSVTGVLNNNNTATTKQLALKPVKAGESTQTRGRSKSVPDHLSSKSRDTSVSRLSSSERFSSASAIVNTTAEKSRKRAVTIHDFSQSGMDRLAFEILSSSDASAVVAPAESITERKSFMEAVKQTTVTAAAAAARSRTSSSGAGGNTSEGAESAVQTVALHSTPPPSRRFSASNIALKSKASNSAMKYVSSIFHAYNQSSTGTSNANTGNNNNNNNTASSNAHKSSFGLLK